MRVSKKVLTILLAVVMVISLLPVSALAVDSSDGIVIIAGSDFQDPDDSKNSGKADASAANVKAVLDAIKVNHPTADGLIFCGDYDKELPSKDVTTSIGQLKSTVEGVFGTDLDEFFVQGNHDQVTQGTCGLTGPGAHDTAYYGVYIIDEDDYQWGSYANESKIKTTAANLKKYLDAKVAAGYDKPIFVASHVPLHFTPRTQEGDGKYAKYIFDELQAAGEAGLKIIFMYGHDHSQGFDNYLGGAAVYLPMGENINIAVPDGKGKSYTENELAFTYMNAGFTGYYADWEPESDSYSTDSGVDKTITMSVFTITDDMVTVERYDANGVHTLKSEGKQNVKHTSRVNPPLNTNVYPSPQYITLPVTSGEDPVTPPVDPDDPITPPVDPDDTVYAGTYEYVDSVTAGEEYLIVSNGYALQNDNGVISAAKVNVNDDGTISVDETAGEASILWQFNANSSYTSSGEFTVENGGKFMGRVSGDAEQSTKLLDAASAYSAWSYIDNGTHLRQISAASSTYVFYLYNRDGDFYVNYINNIEAAQYDYTLKLYEKLDEEPDEPIAEPTTFTDEATGITVTSTSGDAVSVAVCDNTVKYDGIEKYQLFDITVANYEQGTPATVTIPVPSDYNADRVSVYYLNSDDELEDMGATVENGVATFTTTHFSTYMLANNETVEINDWVTVEIPGETTYTYTLDTNGINSGNSYLIAAGNSANILYDNNGIASMGVTINNNTIVLKSDAYDWTITSMDSNNSYRIQNGNRYLKIDNGHTLKINTETSYSYWTLVSRDGGSYNFKAYSAGNYYIQYSNNTFSATSTSSSGNKRLFRLTDTSTATGETYYLGMTGETEYEFPVGNFATQAELETYLKDQVKVYKSSSKTAGTTVQPVTYTLTGRADPTTVGSATYTVSYDGHTVGTISVTFKEKSVTGIAISESQEGTVYRASKPAANTGASIIVYYDDGSSEIVPVTLSMLSGDNLDVNTVGVYENLTVTYGGKSIGGFKLNVIPRPTENDYPEYPDEGSVRVGKTGDGIDFTSTGVAEIELSATGVPANKGIDVIVMVDTSSSMDYGAQDGTDQASEGLRRINFLRNSLREMLRDFQEPNEDGTPSDIRVAIADFNGYTSKYTGTRNAINFFKSSAAEEANGSAGTNPSTSSNVAKIFTNVDGEDPAALGTYDLTDAFVDVNTITVNAGTESRSNPSSNFNDLVSKLTSQSGTNYDYAFDTIYQLGEAIKAQNEAEGEERELYVIFMSDGCPYQYNYYRSQSTTTLWNDWLKGTWSSSDNINVGRNGNNSNPEYYNAATGNSHRMADAIKGSPEDTFTVIRTNSNRNETMTTVPGLGATMYSVGFCIYTDTKIQQATIQHVIENIASVKEGTRLYYNANDQQQLTEAFTQISHSMKQAATDAYFMDKMGDEYDIQLASKTYTVGGETKTINPQIVIKEYDIYKNSDVDGTTVTKDMVGQRKDTYKTLETVTFNSDGTEAYSDKLTGNILKNGVICGKTFWYNTSTTAAANIDVDGDGTAETSLPAETFYWKIGTIGETEFTLSYYVYLTGSMEGKRPEGNYPTNKYATLHYTNWLGNDAEKDTVSPILPWGAATVSYAFYLVDPDGNVVVNQSSGATGTFNNRVVITQPQIGQSIYLNSGFDSMDIDATAVLPEGYTLFDPSAAYNVHVASYTGGSYWNIDSGVDKATTYVTGYSGNSYTTDKSVDNSSYDYTHTTVWFAVMYELKCVPDVVVIDYGLPVDISVIVNDMFGNYGSLAGIGLTANKPVSSYTEKTDALDPTRFFKSQTIDLRFGSIVVNGSKVRYTPRAMEMPEVDTFAYAIKYTNGESPNNGYYYGDVTVVPATIIYYEDTFVTFDGDWSVVTDNAVTGNQAEDRPGTNNLAGLDANNIYGYDAVNANCSTYSLGSAHKVNVSAANNPTKGGTWPTATFTFTGSAFDIISLSSNATGTIGVDVYEVENGVAADEPAYTWAVDTYYGLTYAQDGYIKFDWKYGADGLWHCEKEIVTTAGEDAKAPANPTVGATFTSYEPNYTWTPTSGDNALYQTPVIKSIDLGYGTYKVVITPTYAKYFDHTGSGNYDFYMDAVRIYTPSETNVEQYYKQDNEAYPQFIELRNSIISQDEFSVVSNVDGAVFIDAFGEDGGISEYTNFGPNNEVYLAPQQAIAFTLDANGSDIDKVHIGAKCVNGDAKFEVLYLTTDYMQRKTIELQTSTDMYYDVTDYVKWDGTTSKTVVIRNTGDKIVSLTNVKITFETEPVAPAPVRMFSNANMVTLARSTMLTSYVAAHTDNTAAAPVVDEPVIEEPVVEEPVIEEPEIEKFAPETFNVKLSKSKVKVGDKVTFTITTSGDVVKLTVNGKNAVLKKTNKKTGEKTWECPVTADKAGELTVSVVAYNSKGIASSTIENVITVAAKSSGKGKKA